MPTLGYIVGKVPVFGLGGHRVPTGSESEPKMVFDLLSAR